MSIKLKPLDQQVMVITGASSGIGLATALAAAKRKVKLVLAARSTEVLDNVVRRITDQGGEAIAVPTDVSRLEDLQNLAKTAIARFGRIDTWVNDAAVAIYGRLDEVTEEDSRRMFDINFWGLVNGSLIALPFLKQSGGALINIGSEVSDAVLPLQGMYAASKHAVKGFNDALRIELEQVDRANVAITLIQPTAVDTPYPQHAKNYMPEEPKLPTPMIDPQKVADAILDAACQQRRYVKVGVVASVNTFLAKFAPAIADRVNARQVSRQQYAEPARKPEGTLYQPGNEGRIRGLHGPQPSARP
jgi:short-subunit dehydrogenase